MVAVGNLSLIITYPVLLLIIRILLRCPDVGYWNLLDLVRIHGVSLHKVNFGCWNLSGGINSIVEGTAKLLLIIHVLFGQVLLILFEYLLSIPLAPRSVSILLDLNAMQPIQILIAISSVIMLLLLYHLCDLRLVNRFL